MVRSVLKVMACVLVFVVLVSSLVSAAEIPVGVVVNGENVFFPDARPFIDENGRTQVPVRFVSEALGAQVNWDSIAKKVTVTFNSKKVSLTIGSKGYEVDGQSFQMDTFALLVESRTFVPLRFVSEALGAEVVWEKSTKTVYINIEKGVSPIAVPSDTTTYYDEIAFNNVKDVDTYGRISVEKSKEFVLNLADQLSLVKEDGKYYIQCDYPQIPEGYYWGLNIRLVKPDGDALEYSTITDVEEFQLPESGSFKKEVVLGTNVEDIVFYNVKISIHRVEVGNNGSLNIEYSFDENRANYALESGSVISEDYTDKFDYARMFQWTELNTVEQ